MRKGDQHDRPKKLLSIRLVSTLTLIGSLSIQVGNTAGATEAVIQVGRDLSVGGNLIMGMSKREIEDLIKATSQNEYREKFAELAAESKLSVAAVKEIFRTVVGREADGITTQEQYVLIVRGWVELKSRLERMGSDDAMVASLRDRALVALNRGNRAEAEKLLLQAKKSAVESAKAAQDIADKRLRDAAVSAADLAQLSITNLRFVEAAQRYHEAAAMLPSFNIEDKCGYLINAADAVLEAGDYAAADRYSKEAFAVAQERPGVQFVTIQARAKHRLGRVALARGDNKAASKLLSEALLLGQLSGSKRDQADMLLDISVTHWNESRLKEARESLQRTQQLVADKESTSELIIRSEALNSEGGLLVDLGEFEAAETALMAGLKLRQKLFADQPLAPRLIDSDNNLGYLYRQWERYGDADQHLKKAEAAARLVYGEQHLSMSVIAVNQAIVACNQGKLDLALELINRALIIRDSKLEEQNLLRANALVVKGMILLLKQQPDGARTFISASYKIRSALLQEPDLSLAKSRLALSALQLAENNVQDARTDAEGALTMLLPIVGQNHPLAGLAYRRLGQVFRALKDEFKAKEYDEIADKIRFPASECDL